MDTPAFWGADAAAGQLVYPYINWVPGTAHNGFLEVAVNIGLIGEAFTIWLLALGFWRASICFWQGHDRLSAWPLFVMLYVLMTNFSDATLARYSQVDWIVYVAAFLYATQARKPQEPALPNPLVMRPIKAPPGA